MKNLSIGIVALLSLIGAYSYKASEPVHVGGASAISYLSPDSTGAMRVTLDYPILVVSDGTWPQTNSRTFMIDDTAGIDVFYFSTDNSAWMRAMKYPDPTSPGDSVEVVNYRFVNANGTGPWIALGEDTDEACTGITWQRGILSRWTHGTPQPFCQPVTTGASAGEITTGSTTIEFMLPIGADSLTSGYSIDDWDFLKTGYTYQRSSFDAPGDFTNRVLKGDQGVIFNFADEAYTVQTDGTSIANGRTFAHYGSLVDSKGVNNSSIQSSCVDCHAENSIDILAIWSPYEAFNRCKFHGGTDDECDDTVAYLAHYADSVGVYDYTDRPGRRWYMFMQARPGVDDSSTVRWMVGDTWRNVLNDDQMYQEMYGATATKSDLHFSTIFDDDHLNPRETRWSIPGLTWAKMLPRKGMSDVIGSRNAWHATDCYDWFQNNIKTNIDNWLGGSTSLVTLGGQYRDFSANNWFKNKCLTLDDSDPQGDVSWQHQLDRYSIRAYMSNTYYWYLLEKRNNYGNPMWDSTAIELLPPATINGEMTPRGIFRMVQASIQLSFGRAPHRDHTQYNLGESSIHWSSYTGYGGSYNGGPTESAQWYAIYLSHNQCNRFRQSEPTPCDDQKYTMDHLRTLSDQGSTFGQAALTLAMITIGQLTNEKGISTGGGRFPRHDWLSNWFVPAAYGRSDGCGDWTTTQCRLHFDAVVREWTDIYSYWDRADVPANRQDNNSDQLDFGTANIATSGTWSDDTNGGASVTTATCPGLSSDPTSNSLYVFQFSVQKNYAYMLKCAMKAYAAIGGSEDAADSLNAWAVTFYTGAGSNDFLSEASFSSPSLPGSTTLSNPSDAATDVSLDVTLSWSTATDATSYTLQYDTDSGFGSPTTQSLIVGTSYQPNFTESDIGATIYWRVKGVNSAGDGSYSTARSFTIVTPSAWSFGQTDNGTFSEDGATIALADTAGSGKVWAWFGSIDSGESFSAVLDSTIKPASSNFNDGFGLAIADTSTAYSSSTVQSVEIRNTGAAVKLVVHYAGQVSDSLETGTTYTPPATFCGRLSVSTSGSNYVVTPEWAVFASGSCGTYEPFNYYGTNTPRVFVLPNTSTLQVGVTSHSRTVHADVKGYAKDITLQ